MFGELVVVDDVPAEFAERVVEAYHRRPNDAFSICLSGGETARRCYERLAEDAGQQIDWWTVDVYWGDERCVPFVRQWHRALAAATATSVHLDGPGRFYLSGPYAGFVDLPTLSAELADFVKMSPLQGSAFEIEPASDDTAIIGAAVSALARVNLPAAPQ